MTLCLWVISNRVISEYINQNQRQEVHSKGICNWGWGGNLVNTEHPFFRFKFLATYWGKFRCGQGTDDRDGWVSLKSSWSARGCGKHGTLTNPNPNCTRDHSSDRSPDKQSYDQTNTGALIRPACFSANPGIQGAALTLPQRPSAPGRHWSCRSNVNTKEMFRSYNGI